MSDSVSLIDPPPTESRDAARIADVKAWLASQFEASAKEVPAFEYTSRSVAHLYNLATLSQAKTKAANIVAADFRQKAAEYRSQGIFFFSLQFSFLIKTVIISPPPHPPKKSYLFICLMVFVAARIREILENVGLAQESLPSNVVSSAQVLANVANLLNIRDTELSRWVGYHLFHRYLSFLFIYC